MHLQRCESVGLVRSLVFSDARSRTAGMRNGSDRGKIRDVYGFALKETVFEFIIVFVSLLSCDRSRQWLLGARGTSSRFPFGRGSADDGNLSVLSMHSDLLVSFSMESYKKTSSLCKTKVNDIIPIYLREHKIY